MVQDILRRVRYVLTLTGRQPFRLAGLEMFERLTEVVTCLDTLIPHRAASRLVQLRQDLGQALDAVRSSCAGRRMAQTAAHLVEQVIPWVPTRQWVVSVPILLGYWMASSKDLNATVHTIIHTTSGQYYCNQAVKHGVAW
jgi:hypothetical protein